MKFEPRYGYYPWWPLDGDVWIHPEDVAIARRMIPSRRIWRRDGESGQYVVLHYGDVRLRVLPTLWKEVRGEGLEVGDWVEVLSRMGRNKYRISRLREIVWDERTRAIRYQVEDHRQPIATSYTRDDLRPVEPIS